MKNRGREFLRGGMKGRMGLVGSARYLKASWPVRYGLFHELQTASYLFQFSPEGVIRFIQGRPGTWHDHADWFKRTAGGDWVYYSSGGYNGAFSAIGEHYIPVLPYPTNNVIGEKTYPYEKLEEALYALEELTERPDALAEGAPSDVAAFLGRVARKNRKETLESLGRSFHELTQGMTTVLPPDSRHVDYDILPIRLAKGCLYHCRFCGVKSPLPFAIETETHVKRQVADMVDFFQEDLVNMGGVFLGEHDALAAGADKVVAAARACETLIGGKGLMAEAPSLFLFGSPDALMGVTDDGWKSLSKLPFQVRINTGIESLDEATLHCLGRPTSLSLVRDAVRVADDVMQRYDGVTVSLNMVTGTSLPPSHHDTLARFAATRESRNAPLYLSPLKSASERKHVMSELTALKRASRVPLYLYLLQRL